MKVEYNLVQTTQMKKLFINADISQSEPGNLYITSIQWSELRFPDRGYFRSLQAAKNWVKSEIDPANNERFKWVKHEQ